MSDHATHRPTDASGHHVVPVSLYLAIFGGLMALTAVTIGAAKIDLGPLNVVVALLIAGLKATLVILYFMHVRYSKPQVWIFVGAGFLWLAILLTLTISDYLSRGW